jgi:uncharacterized protein
MTSPWSILLLSLVVEGLLFVRPEISGGPAVQLFGDLAQQSALLAGAPLLWTRILIRARLGDYGLHLRGFRRWRNECLLLALPLVALALLLTRVPAMHAAYPRFEPAQSQPWLLVPSTAAFAIYGLSWEFFFRGWILFGLRPRWGVWANVVQAVPCALLHMGKPNLEWAIAFPVALGLGALAMRWGTLVPGFLLHAGVALAINLGCIFWPLAA